MISRYFFKQKCSCAAQNRVFFSSFFLNLESNCASGANNSPCVAFVKHHGVSTRTISIVRLWYTQYFIYNEEQMLTKMCYTFYSFSTRNVVTHNKYLEFRSVCGPYTHLLDLARAMRRKLYELCCCFPDLQATGIFFVGIVVHRVSLNTPIARGLQTQETRLRRISEANYRTTVDDLCE